MIIYSYVLQKNLNFLAFVYSFPGKHEAIVKNVHELLTKLAWDLSAEQLDHLFELLQRSWNQQLSRKQREKLLELIRRLAEDDKEGVLADKVEILAILITFLSSLIYLKKMNRTFSVLIYIFQILYGCIVISSEKFEPKQKVVIHEKIPHDKN